MLTTFWRVIAFLLLIGVLTLLLGYGELTFPPVEAASIQGVNARTTFTEGTALRSFAQFVRKSRDDRDLDVFAVPTILNYSLLTNLTVSLAIPYVHKELEMRDPATGRRITLESSGLGDIRLFSKYRFWSRDTPRGTRGLAAFGGLQLPSGSTSEEENGERLPQPLQPGTGAVSGFLGLAGTYVQDAIGIEGGVTYTINSEANDFRFGNVVNYDLALEYQIFPQRILSGSQVTFLVEFNGEYAERNESNGLALGNTGGHTLLLSPGIQFITPPLPTLGGNLVLEVSGQVPIFEDLNEDPRAGPDPLKTDYALLFGLRYIF